MLPFRCVVLIFGGVTFDLIESFHACKQEEGKSVADYVLKMKGYVEQLERLGYMLPQDISIVLILNGLTKDFIGFVRNYNMHKCIFIGYPKEMMGYYFYFPPENKIVVA
ncbi:hypothetical protein Tco_0426982, partial [Tanacetum coccineum]